MSKALAILFAAWRQVEMDVIAQVNMPGQFKITAILSYP
jgi:hypothetical protein